MIVPSSIGESL